MKLRDFKGLFKSSVVTFKKSENVGEDLYQVHLNMPADLTWRPGEHGIFTIKGKKFKGRKWHAFSVASIKEENEVLIGTRTGDTPSPYKNALLNMEKGDKIKLRGPFGWFVFEDEETPVVLIALGVGVTPIRSLLMSVKGKNKPVDVIYSAKSTYLFKSDIDEIVKQSKRIDVHYLDNQLETSNTIIKKAKALKNSARYFISGNTKSIKEVKKLLKLEGIKSKNIVHDPFIGY
jgi:predicted ferric reductase